MGGRQVRQRFRLGVRLGIGPASSQLGTAKGGRLGCQGLRTPPAATVSAQQPDCRKSANRSSWARRALSTVQTCPNSLAVRVGVLVGAGGKADRNNDRGDRLPVRRAQGTADGLDDAHDGLARVGEQYRVDIGRPQQGLWPG
jgi:hypothetical protein